MQRRSLTFRALSVIACAMSFVLASCGGSSSGGSAGPTTLTLWQYGTVAGSASYLTPVIADFEAAHPGVKITVVQQPTDTYFALLHTALISKTAPDIADLFAGAYLTQLIPYLTDLSHYLPAGLLQSAKGAQFYAKNNSLSQGAYGVPTADQFYNMFYNKALFKKAGITSVPTTWSQLFAACSALKSHGILPFVYGSQGGGAEFDAHEDWSYLASGAYSLSQWNGLLDGSISYDSPPLVAQVQEWQHIFTMKCTNADALTSQTPLQVFNNGKAGMIMGGSWLIPTFKSLGTDLGAMIPPFSTTPQHTIVELPGGGYGVPASSGHIKLATEFMAFLLSPKAQQAIVASGQPPVIATGVQTTNQAIAELVSQASSGKYTQYPMFDNFMQPSVATAVDQYLDAAFVGQASAQAALANLEKTQQALPANQRTINYGFGS